MAHFELHPQLQKDTDVIGHFPLCVALLHKDSAVPWVILVPQRADLRELHHLPMDEQQQFLVESQLVCQTLETLFSPDKLNLGALGNMVPQLHIHHIARFTHDMAWPCLGQNTRRVSYSARASGITDPAKRCTRKTCPVYGIASASSPPA